MAYQQTLDYLFQQLPMFHRIGAPAYKADLANTKTISRLMGHPENSFKSIHIAGTNGKGSTSHFLASILQEAGYKTGLFTSPHLKDFRERIKINGLMIGKSDVTSFVQKYKSEFEKIEPSFFEWTFALASWYFAKKKVDIAIIETGMGGRLDSTNIISPLVSVITNIGLDHTQFLGTTIHEIAKEKAGIIKPDIPIVIGESHDQSAPVFDAVSQKLKSQIVFADHQILLQKWSLSQRIHPMLKATYLSKDTHEKYYLSTPLFGKYQLKNLATVLSVVETLHHSDVTISYENISKGIINVVKNTCLLGRWQIIGRSPLTIADIGHNPDGIEAILEQIALTPHKNLHFVVGVVNDKDVHNMLFKLPKTATYYFCKADIPRGLEAEQLALVAAGFGLQGAVYENVKEALSTARQSATFDDLVIVGGSAFVVAEIV